jgi:hypothetical protein
MLATYLATGGRGFGLFSPALVGLATGMVACALVAIGRSAYHRPPEVP